MFEKLSLLIRGYSIFSKKYLEHSISWSQIQLIQQNIQYRVLYIISHYSKAINAVTSQCTGHLTGCSTVSSGCMVCGGFPSQRVINGKLPAMSLQGNQFIFLSRYRLIQYKLFPVINTKQQNIYASLLSIRVLCR